MPQGSSILRQERQRLGLSQLDLAIRATVSVRTLQFAEGGKANVSSKKLGLIASELGISFAEASKDESLADDQFGRLPWSISRFIREKADPGPEAFCNDLDDALVVIREMRASWKEHLQYTSEDQSDELYELGDQKLDEAFFVYQQRYLSIWKKHPGTIQLAHCNGIRCGVSVVLPVCDSAYQRLRDGEISFMDIDDDDIEEESQNLVLDSAVEISGVGQTPWHRLTDSLIYAVFSQIAVLSKDPCADDFRMISFGASPLNMKRLLSLGFQDCDVSMPEFGFPVCEFSLKALDKSGPQYANASTTAHFARLLKPSSLSAVKLTAKKRIVTAGLKSLQRVVKHSPVASKQPAA